MLRFTIYLVFCHLLLLPGVLGATIYGSVYDLSLDKVLGAEVKIDTTPTQRVFATEGSYSFEVPPGQYTLDAVVREGQTEISSVQEIVTVQSDGTFILDLILYPTIIDDQELLETGALDEVEEAFSVEEKGLLGVVITMVGFLAAFILISWSIIKQGKRNNKKKIQTPTINSPTMTSRPEAELSSDLLEICGVLRESGGRMTQKELRKHLSYSEAKVSLRISELESRGFIKKYRKGRGNILVLTDRK